MFVDAHVLCSPSVGDVDGDGKLEIVFAVSYYFDAHARFDGDVDPSKYAASGLVILDGESLVTKRSVVLDRSAATSLQLRCGRRPWAASRVLHITSSTTLWRLWRCCDRSEANKVRRRTL